MASDTAVANMLALLHELFPTREIGPATLDAFALVFTDWPDAELQTCAMLAAREPGRTFFPTPGEIAAHRRPPLVSWDAEKLLRDIQKLGHHHPAMGWISPSTERVRLECGDTVAAAFAEALPSRLYHEDETTRKFALQEFNKALAKFHAQPDEIRFVDVRRIGKTAPASIGAILNFPTKQLGAGT